jgi:CRISPR-associated protein Cas5d
VQVRGDRACFTRPELKAERVSYPVMTPSAARGVLEAIFWKPEMRYQITKIEVLSPIKWFRIRRNETSRVVSVKGALSGEIVDTVAHRDQRSTLALRDVAYRIHAQVALEQHSTKTEAAYRDQFRRRVTRGACFTRPFLGTREFACDFSDPDDTPPISDTADLGVMLHTIHFTTPRQFEWFTARLENGVLNVPARGIAATAPTIGA